MLITNATEFKLRFSVMAAISIDDEAESFAYIIAKGCGLNIPEDSYVISID